MLGRGYHARVDIPGRVGPHVRVARPLGPQPLPAAALAERPGAGRFADAVVLGAADTSDPAGVADTVAAAGLLARRLRRPVRHGFAGPAEASLSDVVAELRERGARSVAVASYLLARPLPRPGRRRGRGRRRRAGGRARRGGAADPPPLRRGGRRHRVAPDVRPPARAGHRKAAGSGTRRLPANLIAGRRSTGSARTGQPCRTSRPDRWRPAGSALALTHDGRVEDRRRPATGAETARAPPVVRQGPAPVSQVSWRSRAAAGRCSGAAAWTATPSRAGGSARGSARGACRSRPACAACRRTARTASP